MSDSSVHSFEGFSETHLRDLPHTEVVSEEAQNARSSNQELESELVRQGNSGASPSPTRRCFSRSEDLEDTIHRILNKVLCRGRDRRRQSPYYASDDSGSSGSHRHRRSHSRRSHRDRLPTHCRSCSRCSYFRSHPRHRHRSRSRFLPSVHSQPRHPSAPPPPHLLRLHVLPLRLLCSPVPVLVSPLVVVC